MKEELLLRYLDKKCSDEELKKIHDWISLKEDNAEKLFELESLWMLKDQVRFSDKEQLEKAYSNLMLSLNGGKNKQLRPKPNTFRSLLKYVAAIIIISSITLNIYQIKNNNSKSLNTIEVPVGQRVSLTLSDGTKVWLNSESKFTYPSNFSSRIRSVELDGEGYFEVESNTKSPFIINSHDILIKVIGTKFNIKSYNEEPTYIVLKEGKIEVLTPDQENKVTMHPNEELRFSKEAGISISRNIDSNLAASWINGELAFIENSLEEIVKTLEHRFEIDVYFEDESMAKEIFTCRAKPNSTIEQILDLLKDTRGLDYIIEGNKILIIKK